MNEDAKNLGLTEEEKLILNLLATSYNNFIKLNNKHPRENQEFAAVIHTCQYLIAKRVAARVDPDFWEKYD